MTDAHSNNSRHQLKDFIYKSLMTLQYEFACYMTVCEHPCNSNRTNKRKQSNVIRSGMLKNESSLYNQDKWIMRIAKLTNYISAANNIDIIISHSLNPPLRSYTKYESKCLKLFINIWFFKGFQTLGRKTTSMETFGETIGFILIKR